MDIAKFTDWQIHDMPEGPVVQQKPCTGHIYVIRPVDTSIEVVKIGYSRSAPATRITDLQVGNWNRLEIFSVIGISGASAYAVERLAHKVAAEHYKNLSGEWFGTTAELATYIILSICYAQGCEALTANEAYWRQTQHKIQREIEIQRLREKRDSPDAYKFRMEQREPERAALRRKLGID